MKTEPTLVTAAGLLRQIQIIAEAKKGNNVTCLIIAMAFESTTPVKEIFLLIIDQAEDNPELTYKTFGEELTTQIINYAKEKELRACAVL